MVRTATAVAAVALVAAACASDGGTATALGDTITSTTTPPGATVASTTTTETLPDPAASREACPTDHFLLAVNDYESPQGYPSPELAVTCTEDTLIVESNGIIGYDFVQITPNGLEAQDFRFELPLEPVPADEPLAMGLGTTGVAVNGVAIFAAFEAPQDGYRDPLTDGLLDYCNGHTAPGGIYHYHARMDCLFDETELAGLVYGYSLDGYPIMSPYLCADDGCSETVELSSSYVRVDDDGLGAFEAWEYREGSGDLDECNGLVGDDGVYRYYATDTFPYVPFCYYGETDAAAGVFDGTAPDGFAGPAAG